ncbi:hypothetical protein A3Q56_04777 [Intoshia linei]|uniref:protein-serine/threonine phosphatase n=1 Tax=Intoshia linei TaxID=1819745 RepID=A0A177AZM9_9BILA|nr:hypothetical protein A3Q56_04777 [Intoshia linei]
MLNHILLCSRFISKLKSCTSYHVSKGVAQLLPRVSQTIESKQLPKDTQFTHHLNLMIDTLKDTDGIHFLVELDVPPEQTNKRYVAIVTNNDLHQTCLLGFDVVSQENCDVATIGLVFPMNMTVHVNVDGSGCLIMSTNNRDILIKPITIKAMWAFLTRINKLRAQLSANWKLMIDSQNNSDFLNYYNSNITSDKNSINRWNEMPGIESHKCTHEERLFSVENEDKRKLSQFILSILRVSNLDTISFMELDEQLEVEIGKDVEIYRKFIRQETIILMAQLDAPTQILPYLYLGTEMNACNYHELKELNITHILNMTVEIDNFYPFEFNYKNIRVLDIPTSTLLDKWHHTFCFIEDVRKNNGAVLVHCKMGISRSASTVIAYLMKYKSISMNEATEFVKNKRSIIQPNKGFNKQLQIYEGMLTASYHRIYKFNSSGDKRNKKHLKLKISTSKNHTFSEPSCNYKSKHYGYKNVDGCENILSPSDTFIDLDGILFFKPSIHRSSSETVLSKINNSLRFVTRKIKSDGFQNSKKSRKMKTNSDTISVKELAGLFESSTSLSSTSINKFNKK